MHLQQLTPPEQRVLGCLIEKRLTTPDQYPLTLNALRLACNQSTNRDPVTRYDEGTVRAAAERLTRYGLARLASGHSSRAIKFRHLAGEVLGVAEPQLALLAVMLLRGPQTPGELRTRSERLAGFASLAEVEAALAELADRGYVQRLERRPGQKEDRYEQLLGEDGRGHDAPPVAGRSPSLVDANDASTPTAIGAGSAATPGAGHSLSDDGDLRERVEALEREVARLRELLD